MVGYFVVKAVDKTSKLSPNVSIIESPNKATVYDFLDRLGVGVAEGEEVGVGELRIFTIVGFTIIDTFFVGLGARLLYKKRDKIAATKRAATITTFFMPTKVPKE